MNTEFGLGMGLVLLGGFLTGSFALPMKRMPAWRWEHTWLIYSFSGMVIVPSQAERRRPDSVVAAL
jgi:hypothetical protein